MPVYIDINAAHDDDNALGITDTQTIAIATAGAILTVLILTGVIASPALIVAGVLALLASYGGLYVFDNVSNSVSNALANVYGSLFNMFGQNSKIADIIISVIIIVLCLGLAYLGYEIYENF